MCVTGFVVSFRSSAPVRSLGAALTLQEHALRAGHLAQAERRKGALRGVLLDSCWFSRAMCKGKRCAVGTGGRRVV